MKRKIVSIDEELCNGCELCVSACHEKAIEMVEGKARLVSDIYCDGLGDCLPACPTGAIKIIEREANPFDEVAVKQRMKDTESPNGGCPGLQTLTLPDQDDTGDRSTSWLKHWPVQLHLVSPGAKYFHQANLLVAADCTAFACGDFHQRYLRDRVVVIACPKLDDPSGYVEKLALILKNQDVESLSVLRMVVPCCGGITHIVREAVAQSQTKISINEITLDLDGNEIS